MAYESFIIAAIICGLISLLILVLTFWGFKTKIEPEKTSVYECGFTPFSQARSTFDIKFYLIALLFIVFDVEILFLFPIALNKEDLNIVETSWISFFILFIFAGIYYEIKSKALEI
jgi:NADH:ubiquinone oxidoreductase subunit 3 (subunit A)